MKKLLGISLVAVLAVSPLMAHAADTAPSTTFTNTGDNKTSGLATATLTAPGGAYFAGKTITDNDKKTAASASYVKGAFNDAVAAVNAVASDVSGKVDNAGNFTANDDSTLIKNKTVVAAIKDTATAVDGKVATSSLGNKSLSIDAASLKVNGVAVLTSHQNISGKQDKISAGNGIALANDGKTVSADLTSGGGLEFVGETDGQKTISVKTDGTTITKDGSGNLKVNAISADNIASGSKATGSQSGAVNNKLATQGYVDQKTTGMVTTTGTATLTNKTIDAGSNTISGLGTGNFTDSNLSKGTASGAVNNKLATQGYVDEKSSSSASAAVSTAIGALDSTVTQSSAASNNFLQLQVTEADGKITGVSGMLTLADTWN